jgi:hypothetical protein
LKDGVALLSQQAARQSQGDQPAAGLPLRHEPAILLHRVGASATLVCHDNKLYLAASSSTCVAACSMVCLHDAMTAAA